MGRFAKVDGEGECLIAVDEAAIDAIARLRDGEQCDVEVLFDQTDEVLRKRVFAIIGAIAKVLWLKPDVFRAQLLFLTGHYTLLGVTDAKQPLINVQSMSRSGMSDRDLREFWHQAEQVIRERIVPTLDDASQAIVIDHLDGNVR